MKPLVIAFGLYLLAGLSLAAEAEEIFSCSTADGGFIQTENLSHCVYSLLEIQTVDSYPKLLAAAPSMQEIKFNLIPIFSAADKLARQRLIQANLIAAAQLWGQFLENSANIELIIRMVDNPRHMMQASSKTSMLSHKRAATRYFHQGASSEFLTQTDPNGWQYDAEILIDKSSLSSGNIWLDPQPFKRRHVFDVNQYDAVSMFAHELGHVLCHNGFYNIEKQHSRLPNGDLSRFDDEIKFIDGRPFFTGALSISVYGSYVPLTKKRGVYSHLMAFNPSGEIAIMAEGAIKAGKRYVIRHIDLAMMHDCGLILKPEILKILQQSTNPMAIAKP